MDSPQKKGNAPGRMLGSLAGKIAHRSHMMRRKTGHLNSRVTERWRKSPNIPTTTVDEEFEALILELDTVTDACEELIAVYNAFINTYSETVQSSQQVVALVHQLSKPSANADIKSQIKNEALVSKLDLCEGSKSYAATLNEVMICLKETLGPLSVHLDERIRRVLMYSEKIRERVSLRDRALSSFDRVYDKVDNLTILSTTGEFSAKQRSEWKTLDKKLRELGRTYDEHNEILKSELPCFFVYVRAFMEPLTQLVFFVHLTATYETQCNISAVCQLLDKSGTFAKNKSPTFKGTILKNHVNDISRGYEALTLQPRMDISQKKDRRKKPPAEEVDDFNGSNEGITPGEEHKNVLFRATHNFTSVADTDLEFTKGDVIQVASCEGEWWLGSFAGREGIFPSSFVEKVS